VSLRVHTGTHVETGLHYVDGRETIDAVEIGRLVGPARVLDLTGSKARRSPPTISARPATRARSESC
jgi:kynurenine formamidase